MKDWKFLTEITEASVKSWRIGLQTLSNRQLQHGLSMMPKHKGYFDLGVFVNYCESFRSTQQPQDNPRLPDLSKIGNDRFQELYKVTQATLAEPGEGPLTRASRDGLLTREFVGNLSADEIIAKVEKNYE